MSDLGANLRSSERILVRGVNWLGDAVMSMPALQRLREARPAAHIALMVPDHLSDLWTGHPDVDQTIPIPRGTPLLRVSRQLHAGQFGTAVVFPNSVRSALEVFLGRIPRRIGYARGSRRILLTDPVSSRPGAVPMHKRTRAEIMARLETATGPEILPSSGHQALEYLHLVGALGALEKALPPRLVLMQSEIREVGDKWLPQSGGGRWLGINPGAQYGPAKRWPAESFIEAAEIIHRKTGVGCVVTGGSADIELADTIATKLRAAGVSSVVDLAGQTSLRELCVLLGICRVVLTNDSGPMHVAAAVGTPVIVPFGSTAPELTGPGLPGSGPHQLLRSGAACAPCFLPECPIDFRCMKSIRVEEVVSAAVTILGRAG